MMKQHHINFCSVVITHRRSTPAKAEMSSLAAGGDDIINLGNGSDIVVYRYDGTDKTNLVAYDGSDVINNFSQGEGRFISGSHWGYGQC